MTDDGAGFDPESRGYGTGLQGMADRLHAHGGSLDVRSSPGAGTTIARAAALPGARGGRMTTAAARWLAGGLLLLTVAALARQRRVRGGHRRPHGRVRLHAACCWRSPASGRSWPATGRRNPIGWLFLAEGWAFAIGVATGTYATYATRADRPPRRRPQLGRLARRDPRRAGFPVRAGDPALPGRPAAVPPLAGGRLADRGRGGAAAGAHGGHVVGGPARPGRGRARRPGPADTGQPGRPGGQTSSQTALLSC